MGVTEVVANVGGGAQQKQLKDYITNHKVWILCYVMLYQVSGIDPSQDG